VAGDWTPEQWDKAEAKIDPAYTALIEEKAETFQKAIPDAELTISIEGGALKEFLDDGKLVAFNEPSDAFIDRDARHRDYAKLRETYERKGLGVPEGEYPNYGWLNGKGLQAGDGGYLDSMYGDYRIVLKDKVKDRATFTVGDSLNLGAAPIPVRGVDEANFLDFLNAGMGKYVERGIASTGEDRVASFQPWPLDVTFNQAEWRYIESQIHGGVTLDDVERIDLGYGGYNDYDASIKAKLDELGIPYGPVDRSKS
jgi:hypothetical protein